MNLLDPRSLQLLAAEASCPGHLLVLDQIESLIEGLSNEIADAKSDEDEKRLTADWRALRRAFALLKNTPQLCHAEVSQNQNYNPELENLKIQQDPRLAYQQAYPNYQQTTGPGRPYQPPQTQQVPYPGHQVPPPTQQQVPPTLPPYFKRTI